MRRSRITFLLPAAALAVLIVLGASVYFSNYTKQSEVNRQNLIVERKINLISEINVEFLKAVRDNRGYRLQTDSFFRTQYIVLRTQTQALLSLYRNGVNDPSEKQLLNAFEEILTTRFLRLDRFIANPASADALLISGEIRKVIEEEERRYKALISYLETKSNAYEIKFNGYNQTNNRLFIGWIILAVVLLFVMTLQMRRSWAAEQQRKEAARLKEQNERINNILEGTNAGTWEWNVQTGETVFNEAWAGMVGYTLSELQPVNIETWSKLVHPDDKAVAHEKLQACFKKETDYYECTHRVKHKDGHWVWILDKGKVLSWTDDGKPLWMFGTHIDISASKQLELELKENKVFIDAVLETVDSGIVVCNAEGNLTYFNKATRQMHGLPEQPIAADKWAAYYHLLEGDGVTPLTQENIPLYRAWKGLPAKDMDMAIRHASGHLVYIKANGTQMTDAEGNVTGAVVAMHDVTAAREAQKRIEESEQKFKGIFNSTFQFIGFVLPDGTLLEANQTALDFAGLQHSDVIQKKFWDCYWWQVNETTGSRLKQAIQLAAKGETVQYEVQVQDKRKQLVTILFHLKPLFNDNGSVYAIIAEGRPIQDIVDAREALLQKNQELEAFASMAAHDLKEPVRSIGNFMRLLKSKYGNLIDATGLKYIDFAVTGSARMSELINDLLDYARADADHFTTVETAEALIATVAQLEPVITQTNARISWNNLPVVVAQQTGLQLLFRNLIGNAIKYQLPGNTPEVTITCSDADTHWQFAVQDNGIGIAKDDLTTVFALFKRLHASDVYNGTGMGLATCKKIAELHGGRIWAESEEGAGSCFYFTISKQRIQ